jgi:hypothetical protein
MKTYFGPAIRAFDASTDFDSRTPFGLRIDEPHFAAPKLSV